MIKIDIKEKIARLTEKAVIICGNSDYLIDFAFDEEWAAYDVKTARFIYNGKYTDVVFNGNQCKAPILQNVTGVFVGVFAGELHTTTPAYIPCEKSILCSGGTPEEPTPDVYAQIIELINAGMIKGEKGEKGDKGDKGAAGSIHFIVVTELPTENIDESAIYMKPKADSEVPNLYEEYICVDGQWELLGSAKIDFDLTDYVKNTDIAGNLKPGLVAGGENYYGFIVTPNTGLPRAISLDLDKYTNARKSTNQFWFISNGTLENIKNDYVKRALTENDITLTDEEKALALAWLGAVGLTDIASKDKAGVIYLQSGTFGIGHNKGAGLYITQATEADIDKKTNQYQPITPKVLDYAVKSGLIANKLELTNEEKQAVAKWLGISSGGGGTKLYIHNLQVTIESFTDFTIVAQIRASFLSTSGEKVTAGNFNNITKFFNAISLKEKGSETFESKPLDTEFYQDEDGWHFDGKYYSFSGHGSYIVDNFTEL